MTEQTVLGGRYALGEVLGRGGMAEVRLGHDLRLGRPVAVKMLRSDLAREATFQTRFRREAQSAASLNHPSIVAVYDTGEAEYLGASVPYIVMEYVEGTTLRDLLASGRRLLPERALEIARGILDALDYSHRMGIVHRDIKPANVMLTPDGSVKVMDFGIARALSDESATMTQTSAVLGTAAYLSPEQARGEAVDVRTDLYSTGCLLYELLCGRPPFVGDSPVSVAYQHVREAAVPPSTWEPEISPAIDAVVLKSLAKDRNVRYQSAAEMSADISRVLSGMPVTAPPVLATRAADVTTRMPPVGGGLLPGEPVEGTVVPGAAPVLPAPPPRRRTGAVGWVVALLVLALVFLAALLVARALVGGGTTQITVPSVVGQTLPQATSTITTAGLKVGNVRQQASDRTAGTVLVQDPTGQSKAAKGSEVDLTVAVALQKVQVPRLVGLQVSDAALSLRDAGLVEGPRKVVDNPNPKNQVVAVSPAEGTLVAKGSPVTLTISSGSAKLPDVRGLPLDQARAALRDAGFTNTTTVQQQTTSAAAGSVLDQSPAPGAAVSADTLVTLQVATAPPPPTQTPVPTPTPSATVPASPSPSPSAPH